MMIKDLLGFAAYLSLFVLAGCGGQVAPASVASGEAEFEQGKTMAISGDHAGALAKLDNAIKSGVLGPDLHSEALLYRAQCLAVTGKVDEANADIENATMGGPSEALLEFTKGVVLDKQGKESESKAAFAKAAKLDPLFKNRK